MKLKLVLCYQLTGDKPWYQVYHNKKVVLNGTITTKNVLDFPESIVSFVYSKLSEEEKNVHERLKCQPTYKLPTKVVPMVIPPVGNWNINTIEIRTGDGFSIWIDGDEDRGGNCLTDLLPEVDSTIYSCTNLHETPMYQGLSKIPVTN